MKKVLILSMALAFVVSMSAPVLASGLDKPIDKLTGGFVDVLESPMLIVKHPVDTMDKDGKGVGLVKGLIETPFKIVTKAGHGAIDIATFPVE